MRLKMWVAANVILGLAAQIASNHLVYNYTGWMGVAMYNVALFAIGIAILGYVRVSKTR